MFSKLTICAAVLTMVWICTAFCSDLKPGLYINVHEPDGPRTCAAVRTVRKLDGIFYIGVWGGMPFTIKVINAYNPPPDQILIAMSDGQLYDTNAGLLPYDAKYLTMYYGLAIARFADGSMQTEPFRIGPAWRNEDIDSIPKGRPVPTKPSSDEVLIQSVIDKWWESIVRPMQRELDEEHAKRTNNRVGLDRM